MTANSYLTTLADSTGVSGSSVTNIHGNGFNVYYDSSQSANSYLGGQTYSLADGGLLLPLGSTASCSYSATAGTSTFAASGGSGTIAVTASNGCAWTATSDSSWLTISSGASGSGSGSVVFAVAANTNTSVRTATVSIAGQTVTITQAEASASGGCTYSLAPTAATFDAGGGTGSLAVSAASGCSWTAASGTSWITIASGASGTGSGTVSYTVAANSGTAARTGTITAGGATLTVTETNLGTTALRFVPMTPCRLVDTREGTAFGGAQFAAQETRSYTVPSGGCNVPSNAAAYSLNVAVVPVSVLGYLTLWPAGLPQPLVSTVNSVDGRIKSNAAIVPAGTNGAISLYATHATDIVLDLNGYFVPASTSTGLAFYPVTPCRAVDTRLATGDLGGPSFTAAQTRNFPLRGTCNLPATAEAYSLNIAAVPSGPLGYLTAWPSGVAQPEVATLNAVTGTVTANAAIVEAGSDGSIDVYASHPTDVVIDVNGYFAPVGTGGLSFYAMTPCRVVDTRTSNGNLGAPEMAAEESRTLPLRESTSCSVSSAAEAYSLAAAVVPDTVLGYLTLWAAGATQPYVATLNAVDGAVTSNAAIVPAGTSGGINAYVTHKTHLILDLNGYFAQ